jgi:nitrate reductase NapD
MNISGVIVHSKPQLQSQVEANLKSIEGVEIHAMKEDGRFVVTVEGESDNRLFDTVNSFQDIEGVLSASMVYHNFEEFDPEEDSEQEASQ